MGVHLPHCPAAVDLHGSFGDADIAGNLFAKATLRDVNHDFGLRHGNCGGSEFSG
jgi:hypothetical protein